MLPGSGLSMILYLTASAQHRNVQNRILIVHGAARKNYNESPIDLGQEAIL